MNPLLEVNSLTTFLKSKKDKKHSIIEDVSFTIDKGEIIGLVGESGCGKSMTALSILKLLPKNIEVSKNSSVKLLGKEISDLSHRELRKIRGNDISMIFQEPMTSLNPVMKIGRQIREIIQ